MMEHRILKRGESTRLVRERAMKSEPVALPKPNVPTDQCPKCGKRVGRGRYMHVKNCKGV